MVQLVTHLSNSRVVEDAHGWELNLHLTRAGHGSDLYTSVTTLRVTVPSVSSSKVVDFNSNLYMPLEEEM